MGTLTHGSLFSGIGGFDLAAEWMGWENKFHCEWNEFGQRVLNYYWPEAELFKDITKSDFKKYYGTIDVISGGFPCQPYSAAGKRLGKEDERHLWPEMLRVIREVAPRYVVGENVRGLTNWNGGMVFDEVCTDLENLGYQVAPYIIPASAVNAPHQRERVFFIAHNNRPGFQTTGTKQQTAGIEQRRKLFGYASDADRNGFNQRDGEHEKHPSKTRIHALNDVNENDERGYAADTSIEGLERLRRSEGGYAQLYRGHIKNNWQNFPTQSPICSGDDGLPTELDGVTFSKWRNESIKAYGNAVVPPLIFEIFKAIEAHENL